MKIFLIACSIKEAEKLHTALEYRFVFISVFSPFHSLQSLTCAIEFRINQLKTDKENGVGEAEDDESVKVSLLLPPMNPQDDGVPLICHQVRRNSFQENEEGGVEVSPEKRMKPSEPSSTEA